MLGVFKLILLLHKALLDLRLVIELVRVSKGSYSKITYNMKITLKCPSAIVQTFFHITQITLKSLLIPGKSFNFYTPSNPNLSIYENNITPKSTACRPLP